MKKTITLFVSVIMILNASTYAFANETDFSVQAKTTLDNHSSEEWTDPNESIPLINSEENKDKNTVYTTTIENSVDNSMKDECYDIYSDEILENYEPIQNNTENNEEFDKSLNSETWVKKGNLFNRTNGAEYIVQGFAVGTNYCYSVEMSSDESSHRLYRKNLNNNSDAELMIPYGTINSLGHSNDMCLVTYVDTNNTTHYYLYVVVHFNTRANSYIVKLEYSGNTYWQVARYNLSAQYASISKVKYYTNSSGEAMVQFLLRKGNEYYTASVRRGQSGSTPFSLATTKRFTVSKPSAYAYYANQGIHYESNKLYTPLFGYNAGAGSNNPNQPKKNVILVYNVSNTVLSSTTISNLTWNKAVIVQANTSSLNKFEIEGIGFSINNPNLNNDLMWFNTNEKNSSNVEISGGIYLDSQNIK